MKDHSETTTPALLGGIRIGYARVASRYTISKSTLYKIVRMEA
jgi:hypothetical protein